MILVYTQTTSNDGFPAAHLQEVEKKIMNTPFYIAFNLLVLSVLLNRATAALDNSLNRALTIHGLEPIILN